MSMGSFEMAGIGGKAKGELMRRDGGKCHLCGQKVLTASDATRDHIIPLSKGGCRCSGNIALAHRSCNERKADSDVRRFTFGTGKPSRRKGHLLVDHK